MKALLQCFGFTAALVSLAAAAQAGGVIEQEQRDTILPGLNQTATSVVGQFNGPYVGKISELWEVLQAVYNCLNPDAANDACLDNVSAITGTIRDDGSPSRVDDGAGGGMVYSVDPGTYPAGTLILHALGDPSARFVNDQEIVNGGGGPANIPGTATAETNGPTVVLTGLLTVIAEPVAGFLAGTSVIDTDPIGTLLENNPELRQRREDEVRAAGGTNVDAVRADVLRVEDVLSATVFENDTDSADAFGRPPHSLEAIVFGGDDQAIGEAIFASKPDYAGKLLKFKRAVTHSHKGSDEHSHEGVDGHTWLDPRNAKVQAEQIRKALARLLPGAAGEFQANFTALAADLDALDRALADLAKALGDTPLLASHPAYNYLAPRYKWNIQNLDLDPHVMPGDDVLSEIRQKLKDRPAKILLWESAPANEIAAKLSSELGLRSIVFSPCETLDAASVAAGQDYLTVMKANIARLAAAL